MKIEITNRRKTVKSPDTVKINQWVQKEITREIRKYVEAGKCGNTNTEIYRMPQKRWSERILWC